MKYIAVWLACACALALLALPGCPGSKPQLILPQQPDQYDQWAQGLQQEGAFYAELQRLQRLYSDAPDLALAAPQAFDGEYMLKSRIEQQRAGLILTDRKTDEQWTLWFFDAAGKGAPKIETIRDEASAGGYSIELSLDGGAASVSIVARWVQGRYLQCTRELTLSGLDQAQQAEPAFTTWALDGAWLPYRMAPGLSGPYGVVPDREADGAWHSRVYPVEAMVPAVAAYDRTHGFMLAVSDDHPRKLDRRYDLGFAIPKGLAPGEQIRCTYTTYDGTRDTFDRPWLASGLSIRDSIVLEPLKLACKSADPTLVEAESAEVIQHVADFVHAYHFVPKPPKLPEPGGIVRVGQLPDLAAKLGQGATLADGIMQAAGPCGAKLCLMYSLAAANEEERTHKGAAGLEQLPLLAGIGIDTSGLTGGKGLKSEQIQLLQQLKQGGLPALVETNIQAIRFSKNMDTDLLHLRPDWFVDIHGWVLADRLASLKAGNDCGWPLAVQPNWHNLQALAWVTRKITDDLARYPDVAGYLIKAPEPTLYDLHMAQELKSPLIGSYDAQNAVFQLHLGEVVRAVRNDAWLLSSAIPNLGAPSWCGVVLPSNSAHADSFGLDGHPASISQTQRLSTFLLNRVFNTQPYLDNKFEYLDFDPEPFDFASLVLRTAGTPNGLLLQPTAAAGFPAFATHQIELQAASGELRVVYSDPEKNAYTGGAERPAECSKQIAILPGNWTGAQSVWVGFHGIGGSLRVDKYNYLSISWEGGGWTGKLPTGYWEIEHPSKGAKIEPGDAVLIMLKPIAPMITPGKPVG